MKPSFDRGFDKVLPQQTDTVQTSNLGKKVIASNTEYDTAAQ